MELAALGLKVDGVSNIDQASGALDKFRSSADRAQGAADGLGSSSAKAKKPIDEVGKAGDKSANQLESLSASATKAGAAIGIAAAATVAAITAMTIATVNQANEITKLSLFSGTTTDEFQKLAAAANLVGIEQDKLGDIFKDTQDKIGDFLQSGAGELNDFFEKIAPKVGVTADSFRGLSGPDALGLYVSSLEKAGASQAEMVFYLEAIANDSTALLPLLKDNATGFRELGDMAEQAGAIMDKETIRAAKEMSAVMWQADIAIGGMKDQMMKGLLPALSGVATAMMGVSTNTAIAEDAGRTLGTMVKGLAVVATGAYAAFNLLGKGIAGAFAVADSADVTAGDFLLGGPVKIAAKFLKGRDKVQQTAEIVKEDLAKTVEDFGKVLDGIWSAGEGGDTDSATKRIADLLEQQSALYKGLGTSISSATSEQEKAAKEAEKAEQAIASQLSALERAREIWGMSEDAVVLYDLAQQGATKTQLAYASGLLETVSALEAEKEALDRSKEAAIDRQASIHQLQESLRASQESYSSELSTAGMGSRAAEEMRQRIALQQDQQRVLRDMAHESAQEIRQAETDAEKTHLQAMFAERMELTKSFMAQELDAYDQFVQQKTELEGNWALGAQEAFANYSANALDLYTQTSEMVSGVLTTFTEGVSDAITQAILYGDDWRESLANIGRTIIEQVIGSLVKMGVQMAVNAVIGQTVGAAAAATSTGMAATLGAAWAAPAALASLATVGANSTAAMAGITSTTALAQGLAISGFKEGGYTGSIGANNVAGVVHGNEFVFDAAATSRIGIPALEAIQAGRPVNTGSSSSAGSSSGRGGVVVNQNNYINGSDGNRTANQIANATARKERMAVARLG